MKNMSDNTDLPCKFTSSLLTRGIHTGEISKLGLLIRLVKHAIWADSFYFLSLLLLSIFKIPASSQPTLVPSSWACWANFYFSRSPSSKLGKTLQHLRKYGCSQIRKLSEGNMNAET